MIACAVVASPHIRQRDRNRQEPPPVYSIPARTLPPALLGTGQTSQPQTHFPVPQPQDANVAEPLQEWNWVPPARVVGIAVCISVLLGVGVLVYRVKPSLPSLGDLWPAQVTLSDPTPESVADVHPKTVLRTTRGVPITPSSKNVSAPAVARRDDQPETGTVLIAPVAPAPENPSASRAGRRSAGARPSAATGDPGIARFVPAQQGSAVAFISSPYVYSALDVEVVPPETVLPQRLGNLRTGAVKPDDKVTIEVVVNDQGIVEAAWGRTYPRNVGESLLLATSLHAAKSWMFYPALKNGVPVTYRKLITFEGY